MTATNQHIRAIAFLAAAIRPNGDWDMPGIVAALEKRRNGDLAFEAISALMCAADPNVRSPGAIAANGPHRVHRVAQTISEPLQRGPWCTSCGQNRTAPVHTTDHPFTERTAPVDPDRKAQLIAETRARMADNPGPMLVERTVDDGPCSDSCSRGAGHTGPHEAPVELANVASAEVPEGSAA